MTAPIPVTPRLRLWPVTTQMKQAMQSSRAAFAELTNLMLPDMWPVFPEAFGDSAPVPAPWSGYLFVRRDRPDLVGNGGFVGPPDDSGSVEIGYEVAVTFRNTGYATEAARGLAQLAFTHGANRVVAHSMPWPSASTAVMQKLGMRRVAEIAVAEGVVWRWQLERADFETEPRS